jgi:hypothetical protein
MTEKKTEPKGYHEVPVPEDIAYPAYPERPYEEARIKEADEK